MTDSITLEVTRYRPEEEDEPHTQAYEVPCAASGWCWTG